MTLTWSSDSDTLSDDMFRGFIYNAVLMPLTTRWYREVLERLPDGACLLDVGIGTGGALADNADLVRDKQLRVTGVDIDKEYVEHARKRLREAGLADVVDIRLESIYDHRAGPYDAIYFAASFMLLPQPVPALQHARTLLKPDGRIFFTQTFSERRSRLLERLKPMLVRFTTIEFGRVTYEDEFLNTLQQGGLELIEFREMESLGKQSYRIAVTAPHTGKGLPHSAIPHA